MIDPALLDRCPACGAYDVVQRGARTECLACRRGFDHAALVLCPGCGVVHESAESTCAACLAAAASAGERRRLPAGLRALAIGLACVVPVQFGLGLVGRVGAISGALGLSPRVATFTVIALASEVLVTVALAAGGGMLLAGQAGAVRFAKRTILVALAVAGLVVGPAVVLLEPGVRAVVVPSVAALLIRSGVFGGGALVGLTFSKDVRELFPGE